MKTEQFSETVKTFVALYCCLLQRLYYSYSFRLRFIRQAKQV